MAGQSYNEGSTAFLPKHLSIPLPFSIRTDNCQLDFLSLGALVHRLDPETIPFPHARSFEVHVSGGEYNAAANLASCFGPRAAIATVAVDLR